MWLYFFLLAIPAWGVLSPARLPPRQANVVWVLVGAILALAMGFRHEVGGDWFTYQEHFAWIENQSFADALTARGDPGYYGLSWLLSRVGLDVHALNFVCATILACGTMMFASRQPRPWLALFAATPYLLIVVGMGYTRQSAAIGCVMIGLVALGEERRRKFVVWVLLGALFHKTAVVLLPVAALSAARNRLWNSIWVGAIAVIGGWLFLYDTSDTLWTNYVVSDYRYASQGAGIRVAMDVVPALIFLTFRHRLSREGEERKLWTWLAIITILCVPLLYYSPTAVDRMALYLIPLQLLVFGRLTLLAHHSKARTFLVLAALVYYAAVQIVWLNFADNSQYWLPYQFIPFWN